MRSPLDGVPARYKLVDESLVVRPKSLDIGSGVALGVQVKLLESAHGGDEFGVAFGEEALIFSVLMQRVARVPAQTGQRLVRLPQLSAT